MYDIMPDYYTVELLFLEDKKSSLITPSGAGKHFKRGEKKRDSVHEPSPRKSWQEIHK